MIKLILLLHEHGLSDLALHLEVYCKFATEKQIKALEDSLTAYQFAKRYTVDMEVK